MGNENRRMDPALDMMHNEKERGAEIPTQLALTHQSRLLGNSNQLFTSSQSPHNGVTKDTLARWMNLTLKKPGNDTRVFPKLTALKQHQSQLQLEPQIFLKHCAQLDGQTGHFHKVLLTSLLIITYYIPLCEKVN
ncbi:reverse transcriptase/ribonuclease h/methyltransferase [Plakobranchus ocellatus]|uniref:Reverse transcriptase/ribonuclease h/methyltransferase n=1 Tax=Plakobranchus ocellatus TaxID=259542 RepID=A0AAV3Y501_9GAST|nr:reverse transcriptase/ribonuclease h/methyltransferase [Plakobranchus ocellatus]